MSRKQLEPNPSVRKLMQARVEALAPLKTQQRKFMQEFGRVSPALEDHINVLNDSFMESIRMARQASGGSPSIDISYPEIPIGLSGVNAERLANEYGDGCRWARKADSLEDIDRSRAPKPGSGTFRSIWERTLQGDF